MQDDERALLREVAAAPASDAPRLVYADWLTAQGRGWGEFVKASIAAGSSPGEPTTKALKKLLRAHAKDGLGPVQPFAMMEPFAFSRGFPNRLSANGLAFAKCAEEAALRAPGATLHLVDVKEKHIDAIAPHVGGFHDGELYVQDLKDRGVTRLCDSGMLAGFGDLKFFGAAFGIEGVAAIAACTAAAGARELIIDRVLDLTPVFASTVLAGLTQLTINTTRITEGLRVNRHALRLLKVGGLVDFDDEDARLLAASPAASSISMLSLSRSPAVVDNPTGLTRRGVLEMIAGLPALEGLWLYGFGVDDAFAAAITEVFAPPKRRFHRG